MFFISFKTYFSFFPTYSANLRISQYSFPPIVCRYCRKRLIPPIFFVPATPINVVAIPSIPNMIATASTPALLDTPTTSAITAEIQTRKLNPDIMYPHTLITIAPTFAALVLLYSIGFVGVTKPPVEYLLFTCPF